MLGGRNTWNRLSRHFRYLQHTRFCNSNSTSLNKLPHSGNGSSNNNNDGRRNPGRDLETFRDLDKLDFMKAAKILFSDPPKKKKFGPTSSDVFICNVPLNGHVTYRPLVESENGGDLILLHSVWDPERLDFHLVQLFFALMPPLAVYLVAQYARHEMRKMDAELEEKKKAEEEAKAKEMEKLAEEEKGQRSDPELLKVKERLEALEEMVKEIVVEKKKQPSGVKIKSGEQNGETEDPKKRPDGSLAAVEMQKAPQLGLGQQQKQQDSEKRGFHQEGKK